MAKNSDVALVGKEMNVIGGLQTVNRSIMNAFLQQGTNCTIFSFRDTPVAGTWLRFFTLLSDLWRFNKFTRERNRKFVFNVTGVEVLLFSVVCILKRRTFYYWLHGDPRVFFENKSSVLLARFFFKYARANIVLHKSFIGSFVRTGGRMISIPNIVPQLLDKSVDPPKDAIRRVVWVGRISPEKNPILAYEAMAELAEQFPEVEFIFISPGNTAKSLQPRSIAPNFRFVDGNGFTPSQYFDSSTVHLFTSHLEAMPGVLFESTSCHAYFVATRCSPWVEDLAALGHGLSVPVDISVPQLVAKMVILLRNNSLGFCTKQVGEFLSGYNEGRVIRMWNDLMEEQ
jgi:glycosyltransferase involved in cell wall biosynthesis